MRTCKGKSLWCILYFQELSGTVCSGSHAYSSFLNRSVIDALKMGVIPSGVIWSKMEEVKNEFAAPIRSDKSSNSSRKCGVLRSFEMIWYYQWSAKRFCRFPTCSQSNFAATLMTSQRDNLRFFNCFYTNENRVPAVRALVESVDWNQHQQALIDASANPKEF